MLLLDKEQKSFKQVKGAEGVEDVVDKDVLFNLHKPAVVRAEVGAEDHDLEHQIADAVRQHLQTLPERIKAEPGKYNDEHRTTATINSMLMNTLIPRGVSVERLNLPFIERVCARYFRKVGQHWYLRGQAVGQWDGQGRAVRGGNRIKDEVTAIDWLRQKLHAQPDADWRTQAALDAGHGPAARRGLAVAVPGLSPDREFLARPRHQPLARADRRRAGADERRPFAARAARRRAIRGGSLRRQTTDDERCEWIEVLFKACREMEDGDTQSTPALRGFDCGEGYRLIARLFQTILTRKGAGRRLCPRPEASRRRLETHLAGGAGRGQTPPSRRGEKTGPHAV